MINKLVVIGAGPGDALQLTLAASRAIASADCVVAADRHMRLAKGCKNVIRLDVFSDAMARIRQELTKGSVAVIVSGDPGIYSLMPYLKKNFPDADMEVLPGISSLQSLCAAARETWNETAVLSGHGRSIRASQILYAVSRNRSTAFFCDSEKNPSWLCAILAENGLGHTEVIVGERLSYHDQRITRGAPAELSARSFDALSIVLVLNGEPCVRRTSRPRDDEFIRASAPMTRAEVRSVIIDRLELEHDSVLWDIGAGTGSVSVAAAMCCPDGEVCAVERGHEEAELERSNADHFRLFNITIHEGTALDVMPSLPAPTRIFVGGSGGEMKSILAAAASLGSGIKVVVSCVTLKTLAQASQILNSSECGYHGFDAVQIGVTASKRAGGASIMAAQNPVTILSAYTGADETEELSR